MATFGLIEHPTQFFFKTAVIYNCKLSSEELKHETATFGLILVIGSFGSNSLECIGIKGVVNYHVFDRRGRWYFYKSCSNRMITVCSSMAVW